MVRRTTPALPAAYSGASYGPYPIPAIEETLTIAPPPRLRMTRMPNWVPSITPRRFTSSVRPQCSGSASGKYGSGAPPALLTK